MAVLTESEGQPTPMSLQVGVRNLINRLGAGTHAVLRLDHGTTKIIQDSNLADAAKGFLVDVLAGEEPEITLYTSEENETPYSEILLGPPKGLRGIQCYAHYDLDPNISLRQSFDSQTLAPLNLEPTRRLNQYLNQNPLAPSEISRGLIAIAEELLRRSYRI
ncbi:MAG: hypothetical protein AAB414_04715 [Patescibacteria group bacterium]